MNNQPESTKRGFTLIELLVVITIIGLLASTVLASLANSRIAARDVSRIQAVKELQKALELYRNTNGGNYPCATVNPACAGAGAAAGVAINTATANNVIGAGSALVNYFKPNTEIIMAAQAAGDMAATTASIVYRVGSTDNSVNNPDRSTYTILVRREQAAGAIAANTWCTISSGSGHGTWTGGFSRCF